MHQKGKIIPEKQTASGRPDTAELTNQRAEKKKVEKQLREHQKTEGLKPAYRDSLPNCECVCKLDRLNFF
ncbi:Uncharacterized protein dnm_026660 [Desulfonema magnum]|uniref:Uncharacterized protein n=1 Tax=Desulfonema magnum TaxID=45655 RepID=A0A975BJX6_9BACT|nr:Uncharacterized protein dnm_026660 [Desulfonema magnum]